MQAHSDLLVELRSESLKGVSLDVVVTGSIGAVESVRFIRALRRLGARVFPWLTEGGSSFVTETALAWASGGEAVRTRFEGASSHLSQNDAVVIAPASAGFLSRIAHGQTSDAASALVASCLGRKMPVLAVANMHESLGVSPFICKNIEALKPWVVFLEPRREEGKLKFPDPAVLADEVSHQLCVTGQSPLVLVTMGSTKGYIDEVRYISNYSSGSLGTAISLELYRQGYRTHVIAGDCPVVPESYTHFERCELNSVMEKRARSVLEGGASAAVVAASVLDYLPETRHPGKIRSGDSETLRVDMVRTKKIIKALNPASGVKVGFKLESGIDKERAEAVAADYLEKYNLSLFVMNDLKDVSRYRHQATLYDRGFAQPGSSGDSVEVSGKQEVAVEVVRHITQKLEQQTGRDH